ncbi:MAG: hypothetical protein FRX49_02791 [Trebouxia sp. A1-2]|nr:MAG: hypothetical protein FRX49_02791 [Trebouxia sp. A1-2]
MRQDHILNNSVIIYFSLSGQEKEQESVDADEPSDEDTAQLRICSENEATSSVASKVPALHQPASQASFRPLRQA